jgi:hypothetical protein
MSHRGESQARLAERRRREEERRRERERCQQVRERISTTLSKCEEQVRTMVSEGSASWIQGELNEISQSIKSHPDPKDIVDGRVDSAEESVNQLLARAQELRKLAKSKKLAKRQELDNREIELKALLQQLSQTSEDLAHEQFKERMVALIGQVEDAIAGRSPEAASSHDEFVSRIREISRTIVGEDDSMQVEENARNHIASSLFTTMREMEFTMDNPRKKDGNVVIKGRLPSGRSAVFNIDISGHMEFDFDGYPGRECEKSLDQMIERLRDEFDVDSSIIQRDWKNPDRISKGSKGLPSGGSSRSIGGGTR